MEIYFDGGSAWGNSVICLVLNGVELKREVIQKEMTSSEIEEYGFLMSMKYIKEYGGKKNYIFSDNKELIKIQSIKNNGNRIFINENGIRKKIFFGWIPREINPAGLVLEKRLKTLRESTKARNKKMGFA